MVSKDIKTIQDALAREGRIEGDRCVVPGDFFLRLNAKLNERTGPSILDRILANEDSDSCSD
jgi:hypothetical protein